MEGLKRKLADIKNRGKNSDEEQCEWRNKGSRGKREERRG